MNDVVRSGPEVGCTVNLIDVVDESFFNLILKLMGSTSDESTLLWRSNNPLTKKKGDLLIICQETCPFSSSKTKNTLKRKEASKQSLD